MENEQDPKNLENEPQPAEELDAEELDQVVGGTDPAPTTSISFNYTKVEITYTPQKSD